MARVRRRACWPLRPRTHEPQRERALNFVPILCLPGTGRKQRVRDDLQGSPNKQTLGVAFLIKIISSSRLALSGRYTRGVSEPWAVRLWEEAYGGPPPSRCRVSYSGCRLAVAVGDSPLHGSRLPLPTAGMACPLRQRWDSMT